MKIRVYFMNERKYVAHVANFFDEESADRYNPPKYNAYIKVIRYVD